VILWKQREEPGASQRGEQDPAKPPLLPAGWRRDTQGMLSPGESRSANWGAHEQAPT